MTRFLVPYLSSFRGQAVFMDCDMLFQADVAELISLIDCMDHRPLYVVKHDYTPSTQVKFLDQPQTTYSCKNWSSFMVFNCDHYTARHLTPEFINKASGLDLHQFTWLDDIEIGELPLEWNWLVDEYKPNPDAKVLHYTLGGPWIPGYENCDQADLWLAEKNKMA